MQLDGQPCSGAGFIKSAKLTQAIDDLDLRSEMRGVCLMGGLEGCQTAGLVSGPAPLMTLRDKLFETETGHNNLT